MLPPASWQVEHNKMVGTIPPEYGTMPALVSWQRGTAVPHGGPVPPHGRHVKGMRASVAVRTPGRRQSGGLYRVGARGTAPAAT